MADANKTESVAAALEAVAKWQAEEQARHQAELGEVDQEMESLRTALANLQQQIDALEKFRGELGGKLEKVEQGAHQRSYDAVFTALQAQAAKLVTRAGQVSDEQRKRDAAVADKLGDEKVKKLLGEYEAFKTQVEPTLAALPESYRAVVRAHHDGVRAELQAELEKLGTGPIAVEGDEVTADVVIAIDAPDGQAAVIMLVLPVSETVHTGWSQRGEDLQTWVAARVMQGVYGVCKDLGRPAAQAMYGGHAGLLAVEAELGGGDPSEVTMRFQTAIDTALAGAPELLAAKVRLNARPVEVDYLFPPDDEEEGAEDEEVSNA